MVRTRGLNGTNSWLKFLLIVGGRGPVRPEGAEEEAVLLFEMATQEVLYPCDLIFSHFLELNLYFRFHTSIIYSIHLLHIPHMYFPFLFWYESLA